MALRLPAVAMTQHLMWTRSGTVWATWRLNGLPKGLGNTETYQLSRLRHQDLFQSILGESLLLGFTADLDPETVVNSMLAGVAVEQHPLWAQEALLTLDYLEERPLGRREFWLCVPLRFAGVKQRSAQGWRSFETSARDTLSMPQRPPSLAEIEAALQAAGHIEEQIPVAFEPHRASVAEQVWIAVHAQSRGLSVDQPAPVASGRSLGGVAERYGDAAGSGFVPPAVFPNPILDEGGQTELPSKLAKFDPLKRRFLKVQNPREETTSYQVLMALAGSPKGGWEVPAVDWIGRIDELGVDADWAIRLNIVPAGTALHRNKRAEANLNDQMDQQEGTAAITGSGGALDLIASDLQAYHQELNRSDKEVEVQASMILAVGAPTPEEARDRAEFLRRDFKRIDFIFDIPLGAQEALWWGMQPGTPTTRQVREFTEIAPGAHFGALAPLLSTDLGDDKGILIAENITGGMGRPVLLDLEGQILADSAASIGCVGEPGAGKSTFIKLVLGATHDRGGKILAIDRTEEREYALFAASLDPEHTVLVDLTEPEVSLDPLRLLGVREGSATVQTLLSALLGYSAQSDEGATIASVLDPDYAEQNELTSMRQVHAHLELLGKDDESARTIAKRMKLYAGKQMGRVLFDDTMPSLDLSKRAIMFLTHGVALPTESELANKHLFDRVPLEKLFGRAMYAMITSLSRRICFASKTELTLFATDEAHHITNSPEGDQEMDLWYREGRRNKAPVLVASQDAVSLGSGRGFIKNRFQFRQTDEELARANLEWFHKAIAGDPELVRMVTEELSPRDASGKVPDDRKGEALYRDTRPRMGKVRVILPRRPDRRIAVLSTPEAAPTELAVTS